jgi:hypothetical protein
VVGGLYPSTTEQVGEVLPTYGFFLVATLPDEVRIGYDNDPKNDVVVV